MRAFGFLSFGHYGHAAAHGGLSARQMLHDAVDITVGADDAAWQFQPKFGRTGGPTP